MRDSARKCRNCQAELTGAYCSQCGQHEGRADQRFMDLAGDLTAELFDLDSRVWRTLFALVFRPGYLTAEYMVGRRARYIPPLRLYLIISFILFLTISLSTSGFLSLGVDAESGDGDPGVMIRVDNDPDNPPEAGRSQGEDDSIDPGGHIDIADEDSAEWLKGLDRLLESKVLKLQNDPGEFVNALVDYLPQLMFFLLPLFALLLRLVYPFAPYHYLEHLVFALHYHSFASLFYLLTQLVEASGVHAGGWFVLILLIYLPLALRKAFKSSWRGAIIRSLLVYAAYGALQVLGFAVLAIVALALL